MILAVDPGDSNGGAVLVDEGEVVAWWAWSKLHRKAGAIWRVSSSRGAYVHIVASVGEIGQLVADGVWQADGQGDVDLVVEALFVPRSRKGRPVDPQSAIPLAEAAGWLMGGLAMGVPVARPLASTWRPAVLCPANTPAQAAEALAVKATAWKRWPGDPLGLLTRDELGAVAEARLMARWWVTESQGVYR